jgi:hypothetical protein
LPFIRFLNEDYQPDTVYKKRNNSFDEGELRSNRLEMHQQVDKQLLKDLYGDDNNLT